MPDVIEAGANGMLTEEVFSEALRVNDAIQRTLEAERTGTRIPVDDDAPETSDLLDLGDAPAPTKTPAQSKVQAALLDLDDDSSLDYKAASGTNPSTVRELSGKFKGGAIKPVGHHGGSPYPATPIVKPPPASATSPANVFGSTSTNDIDLLLTDDKPKETKKADEDFDAFLDSIGASSLK